jgi:hypothetical protein
MLLSDLERKKINHEDHDPAGEPPLKNAGQAQGRRGIGTAVQEITTPLENAGLRNTKGKIRKKTPSFNAFLTLIVRPIQKSNIIEVITDNLNSCSY